MFLSGIFQFLWKMVLHSAVLREGPHQGREVVGFSGIQSPAEPQVFSPDFSLSLSPVFLSSSRRRILWCPLHSVGEKKPFPQGGQGEGWEVRGHSCPLPPRLTFLPWHWHHPQLCLLGVLSRQVSQGHGSLVGFSFSLWFAMTFTLLSQLSLHFPTSKIFLTFPAASPVLSSLRVYICLSPLLSFSWNSGDKKEGWFAAFNGKSIFTLIKP